MDIIFSSHHKTDLVLAFSLKQVMGATMSPIGEVLLLLMAGGQKERRPTKLQQKRQKFTNWAIKPMKDVDSMVLIGIKLAMRNIW